MKLSKVTKEEGFYEVIVDRRLPTRMMVLTRKKLQKKQIPLAKNSGNR